MALGFHLIKLEVPLLRCIVVKITKSVNAEVHKNTLACINIHNDRNCDRCS
jgi:hypothetical protein